jgi:hypothetical protein
MRAAAGLKLPSGAKRILICHRYFYFTCEPPYD